MLRKLKRERNNIMNQKHSVAWSKFATGRFFFFPRLHKEHTHLEQLPYTLQSLKLSGTGKSSSQIPPHWPTREEIYYFIYDVFFSRTFIRNKTQQGVLVLEMNQCWGMMWPEGKQLLLTQ